MKTTNQTKKALGLAFLALTLSACEVKPVANVNVTSNENAAPIPAATPTTQRKATTQTSAPVPAILGSWKLIGKYLNAQYMPQDGAESMIIDETSIVRSLTTMCGPNTPWRKWSYGADVNGALTTMQEGDFIDCNGENLKPYVGKGATKNPFVFQLNAQYMNVIVGGGWTEVWERH